MPHKEAAVRPAHCCHQWMSLIPRAGNLAHQAVTAACTPPRPGATAPSRVEPRLPELPAPSPWIRDGNGTEGRWHRGVQREEEQKFGFSHLHVVTSTKLGPCMLLVWFWGVLLHPQTAAQGSRCVRLQTGAVVWGPWGNQQRNSE